MQRGEEEPAEPEPRSRSSGERVRLRHQLDRLEATIPAIRLALEDVSTPIGLDPGASLQSVTSEIVTTLARLAAYMRAERDAAPPVLEARCPHCRSTDLEPVAKPENGERCRSCRYRWRVIPPGEEDRHG